MTAAPGAVTRPGAEATVRARYTEAPLPSGVADGCEALWHVRFESATDDWLVLPDGCVDIVLLEGAPPLVAGPATGPATSRHPRGARAVGLRLSPGAAPAVLGVRASDLADAIVPLEQLGAGRWSEGVQRAHWLLHDGDVAASGAALAQSVAGEACGTRADPLARHAAELLRRDPGLSVAGIATLTSISERQLRRRFTAHVGYAPKHFARVMRLQRLIGLQRRHPGAHLAWLAARAGYADQAHLVRDSRELAGRTPSALIAQRSTVVAEQAAT